MQQAEERVPSFFRHQGNLNIYAHLVRKIDPNLTPLEHAYGGGGREVFLVEEKGKLYILKYANLRYNSINGQRLRNEIAGLSLCKDLEAVQNLVRIYTGPEEIEAILKEPVQGVPLRKSAPHIKRKTKKELIAAVAYLHSHGFAGLDIGSPNIIVNLDGLAKIIDLDNGIFFSEDAQREESFRRICSQDLIQLERLFRENET